MNWIDISWPLMGGACLTLGLIHLLVWFRRLERKLHLVFALASMSVAAISAIELMMMHAREAALYGELLRWAHVPGAIMFVTLALFVHLQFQGSRTWLCAAAIAARVVALVLNFTTGVNINYLEISDLHLMTVWGGIEVAVPAGTVNPWMVLGQFGIVIFVLYVLDTMATTWHEAKPEDRWRVVRVCGGIAVFVLLVNTWRVSVVLGWLDAPDILVPAFLCVIFVMSNELGGDILRAAQLSQSLDVTEAKLRESEARMDVAVRAGEMGLWSWGIAEEKFWFTDLSLKLLGFAPETKFDRKEFIERIQPADREALIHAFIEATHNEGDFRSEYRIRGDDGRIRFISVRGQMEFERNGVPVRLHGVLADVTERKQQQERFHLAVEASPTAMLMTGADGIVSLANRQAEIVFGYTRSELLGLNVDALVPDRHRERHAANRAMYAAEASARMMGAGRALFGRRKDGSEVPVEIALNPIHVGDNLHVLVSIADISERRRLERESAKHRDELAHLSRVALLAELSGSLAHELNQPLTAILSNAQAATRFMAMDPPNLDEVRESLVNIVESDKRAGEVIRRLRAMLRKEAPEHREIDLNEIVLDVLRIIRSDLLNRNTETVLEMQPNLPTVFGDRVQLQQVLLNLVMNGCDAMAELPEGRRLVLRTTASDDGGVLVSVEDVGRGIPPEDLERIFSPFVSSKADGMGLGLAVCTTILESHHGKLWATNNARRGASFHFRLPPRDGPMRAG